MNRTTVVALVATAAVGMIGGTMTAVIRGDSDKPGASGAPTSLSPSAKPSESQSPTNPPSPTAKPPASGDLLWADDAYIHDGDKKVGVPGAPERAPDRLVRARDGYVLEFRASEGGPDSNQLYFVSRTGNTQFLADHVRTWDLNPAGDRVVVDDARNHEVRGLDGVVQATRAARKTEQVVLWDGNTVSVHALDREVGWRVWTWDPGSGAYELTDRVGFAEARSGRDGRQVVGSVDHEGLSGAEEMPCVGTGPNAGANTEVNWFTCDWRMNGPSTQPVSPEATRLLVVHAQTDGFGPGAFGIVNLATGPAAGVPTVNAPEDWMLDAAWVDEDHFVMVGSNSDEVGRKGGWLYLSDTDGNLSEVARTKTGRITLGEQF